MSIVGIAASAAAVGLLGYYVYTRRNNYFKEHRLDQGIEKHKSRHKREDKHKHKETNTEKHKHKNKNLKQ